MCCVIICTFLFFPPIILCSRQVSMGSSEDVYLDVHWVAARALWEGLVEFSQLLPVARTSFVIAVKPLSPLRLCGRDPAARLSSHLPQQRYGSPSLA